MRELGRRVSPAALALAVVGCSYNWVSDTWLIPSAISHRDSPIVTISNSRFRTVLHHEPSSFWDSGGDRPTSMETVEWSREDLDVRSCKSGQTQHYAKGAEPPRDPTAVPFDEQDRIGSVRFYVDPQRLSELLAEDTATGRKWVAASGFEGIRGVTAVPVARRVVVITEARAVLVYDLDANRVVSCR
jgi:hypothetical protein